MLQSECDWNKKNVNTEHRKQRLECDWNKECEHRTQCFCPKLGAYSPTFGPGGTGSLHLKLIARHKDAHDNDDNEDGDDGDDGDNDESVLVISIATLWHPNNEISDNDVAEDDITDNDANEAAEVCFEPGTHESQRTCGRGGRRWTWDFDNNDDNHDDDDERAKVVREDNDESKMLIVATFAKTWVWPFESTYSKFMNSSH